MLQVNTKAAVTGNLSVLPVSREAATAKGDGFACLDDHQLLVEPPMLCRVWVAKLAKVSAQPHQLKLYERLLFQSSRTEFRKTTKLVIAKLPC